LYYNSGNDLISNNIQIKEKIPNMKNTTLLKVLSATAIFSAVAAIEAYDQDIKAFKKVK
jgi:hypothetical protein